MSRTTSSTTSWWYLCSGTDSEKLEWFKTINIAGEKLTDQELRNAVYAGPWVTDAKRHFSKTGCPPYNLGSDYMSGTPIRDYLETVIRWINDGEIESYMAKQQHKPNANELWLYFQKVMAWMKATFPKYRKEMKGLRWGGLYNEFKDADLDSAKLEEQVASLMADEDVTNKKGIYSYVLDGQEKHLNIRAFSPKQRREAYERQKASAQSVATTSSLKRWKPITLLRGTRAGRLRLPTARCSASRTTVGRAASSREKGGMKQGSPFSVGIGTGSFIFRGNTGVEKIFELLEAETGGWEAWLYAAIGEAIWGMVSLP